MISIAILLYAQSKEGYADLKESQATSLPTARILEHYIEPMRYQDGLEIWLTTKEPTYFS